MKVSELLMSSEFIQHSLWLLKGIPASTDVYLKQDKENISFAVQYVIL